MAVWTVELDEAFVRDLEQRGERLILEAAAIKEAFEEGGPGALGPSAFDLEGVPSWDELGAVVSLRLPEPFSSGRKAMQIEIHPGRRILIAWID